MEVRESTARSTACNPSLVPARSVQRGGRPLSPSGQETVRLGERSHDGGEVGAADAHVIQQDHRRTSLSPGTSEESARISGTGNPLPSKPSSRRCTKAVATPCGPRRKGVRTVRTRGNGSPSAARTRSATSRAARRAIVEVPSREPRPRQRSTGAVPVGSAGRGVGRLRPLPAPAPTPRAGANLGRGPRNARSAA